MDNTEVFKDTQDRILYDEKLRDLTLQSVKATRVFDEGFFSDSTPGCNNTEITVEENLTLIAVRNFVKQGKKTVVLNFANPLNPGGGVLDGANAQEEYLCRAGNLYNCLVGNNAKDYYEYHKSLLNDDKPLVKFVATDRLIYSPKIVFFKEDVGYEQRCGRRFEQLYTDEWIVADVISCAAPYFFDEQFRLPDDILLNVFEKRIINIFEAAIENNIQAVVLGAFGCGAFCNPPEVVAEAFENVLKMERYRQSFENVCFAIKRTFSVCKNLNAFESVFAKG